MKAMKTSDLKDKSVPELEELAKQGTAALFQARLQNFTNQLDDTSSVPKHRRDIARIKGEVRRRELEALNQSIQQAMGAGEESK